MADRKEEEEPIQDDGFSPYGGEEEEEKGADDIERNTDGEDTSEDLGSPDEEEEGEEEEEEEEEEEVAERFEEELDEEEEENEPEDPDYEVWKPNDASHNPPPDRHAIVSCSTTAGPLLMHFHRAWSPQGYERATSLFEKHYYDHSHFFRVVPHFLVQFGIGYTTDVNLKQFAQSSIPDDPKRSELMPFREGMMSFAGSGPNSRSSQLFIAYDKAQSLGTSPWETPFGEVIGDESLETARAFYQGYGDMPPWGKGPQQGPIHQGSGYIEENFPKLDKFHTCTVKRVSELPKLGEGGSGVSGNVRKANGVKANAAAASVNAVDVKMEKQPMIKLFVLVAGAVVIILGLGLRGRKKKKANKSV
jgi:cyclophilin family peptidyl-prolyl cis-trans isomerase